MPEHEEQNAGTRVAEDQDAAERLTEEQEWCRQAGFSRLEWQRLSFTRWLYREGHLTESPEGR